MGILQNDKEKLSFRSRRADKGSDVPFEAYFQSTLRDASVDALVRQCQDQDVGLKVKQAWLAHKSHVEDRQDRLEQLQQWDEYIDDYKLEYDGESNIHLPIPTIVCKTFHARMYQALLAVDPPFSVRAMQEAYQDDVDMVYGLMAWTLREWCNYNEGCDAFVDRWLWNWITDGNSVGKLRWDCQYTRYVDVEDFYTKGPSTYEVIIDPDTGAVQEVEKPAIIRSQRERAVTEKIFEGPVLEYICWEDIAIIGGKDIQQCDMVIHRSWLNANQLNSLAIRKVFDQAVVDQILDGGPHSESGKPGTNIKQDREVQDGVQTLDVAEDLDKYEVLEAHLEFDVNNDGLNESLIVWVENQTGAILRATYAHRVNRGGKRPFFNIEFMPREGHAYAMGMKELLFPISVSMDLVHNIKVDIGMSAAMPVGFYRAATGMDAVKLRVRPGDMIPVDDPSSHVFFPNLGDRSGFFKDEEMLLMQHVERLTSINDITTGTLGRQGAARTATGVAQLVAENSANLDIFIKRMQRGWRQVLRILWQMLQQRMPDGTEFRVTGQDGREYFRKVNRMNIQQRVDFYLDANSANSNKQIQLEQSMQVLAQTMNPLFLQLQIVKPDGVFEALKDYFQALGRKDYARFIARPPTVSRQLLPNEELARVLAGKKVPLSPEMDHQGFIELATELIQDENAIQMYGQDRLAAVQAQIKQHQALSQAMEAQAKQIAQANQQGFNAMGVAGGVQPGQAPFLNPYNDFQSSRANLLEQTGENSGLMQPGAQKPPSGRG